MSIKNEAYLCLSAMLRAREPKLLTNERAERMLDAPSFDEAAKLLTDCGYEDMSSMSAGEIEAALAQHRAQVFSELEQLSPSKEIVDVFKMKYDYHNAKTLVKAEAMGTDPSRLLSASGRIAPEELTTAYNEGRWAELPDVMADAMAEAKAVLARTANPQLADIVLDQAYFNELKNAAEETESSFLVGYAELLTDCANLKSAVRTLRMGKNGDFLQSVLLSGGSVDEARIAAAGDIDGVAALFGSTVLDKAATLGVEAVSGGSVTAFELACDNAVTAYLTDAQLISYGCEPVIAYMAAVEGEITAVRMILTGRLSGVSPEIIRERLRDLYA